MPDNSIWIETLVSQATGEPRVQIAWYDHSAQMTPEETRAFALQIMEAADAATSDAYLVHWLAEKVQMDKQGQAMLLNEFREYRDKREKEKKKGR